MGKKILGVHSSFLLISVFLFKKFGSHSESECLVSFKTGQTGYLWRSVPGAEMWRELKEARGTRIPPPGKEALWKWAAVVLSQVHQSLSEGRIWPHP